MTRISTRIVIYTTDVQKFANCSVTTAKRLLRKVRVHFKKRDRDMVTIMEFCAYMKWDEQALRRELGD